jgi:hypothetical protein
VKRHEGDIMFKGSWQNSHISSHMKPEMIRKSYPRKSWWILKNNDESETQSNRFISRKWTLTTPPILGDSRMQNKWGEFRTTPSVITRLSSTRRSEPDMSTVTLGANGNIHMQMIIEMVWWWN